IDAERAAERESALVPAPVEVEAPGVAVDLDRHAMLGTGGEHLLDIDLVAGTAQQLAPRHMAEDGGERTGDGANDACGLRLGIEPEIAVDARHNEIEARQHLVRIIERAVGEDIGFDALENAEALSVALVQPVDLLMLRID